MSCSRQIDRGVKSYLARRLISAIDAYGNEGVPITVRRVAEHNTGYGVRAIEIVAKHNGMYWKPIYRDDFKEEAFHGSWECQNYALILRSILTLYPGWAP
jgi:hypothetical protein